MTYTRLLALSVFLFFQCLCIHAYEQKEVAVMSQSMHKDVSVTIITPEGYNSKQIYPVVYLLHGHGGNNTVWSREGVVGALSDQYGIIVVMPDGARDSWYFDSPVAPEYCYETFVVKELVSYVDSAYFTIKDRTLVCLWAVMEPSTLLSSIRMSLAMWGVCREAWTFAPSPGVGT